MLHVSILMLLHHGHPVKRCIVQNIVHGFINLPQLFVAVSNSSLLA